MYNNMMEVLKALQSGATTIDQVINDLQSAKMYVRRGSTYYELQFENLVNINNAPANVYALGNGIDRTGKAVEKRQRKPKAVQAEATRASTKK